MLEADTAAIEAYLGEFPYAGSSRIQDKEALKAAGARSIHLDVFGPALAQPN